LQSPTAIYSATISRKTPYLLRPAASVTCSPSNSDGHRSAEKLSNVYLIKVRKALQASKIRL
jgi:hypothetical protein